MKKLIALLAAAILSVSAYAQTAEKVGQPTERPNGLGLGLFNHRVDVEKLPPALKELVTQFRTQRDQMIAERRALIASLEGKTEEQKKAIIEQAREQNKAALEAQRELAKQIHEQLRQLREKRRGETTG